MRRLGFLPVVLALAAWEPLRSPDPDVTAGNKAYAAGDWDAAIRAYEKARGSGVDDAGLAYDLGTAKLRKAEKLGDKASKDALTADGLADLERAQKSKDPALRAEASFNTGNAQLAADQLPEAIESYKQALRDNTELADARTNLELALRRLDKKQQQQQGGGKGQPPPQGGQGPGQPPPQGGQGSGQQPPQDPGGQGSGQPQDDSSQGSGQEPPKDPSSGQGSGQPPQDPPKDPGQGSGQGSGQPPQDPPKDPSQGSGQGSGQPPKDPSGQGGGSGTPQPHGLPSRHKAPEDPNAPKTPSDEKLDDLEASRDLRRDKVRSQGGSGSSKSEPSGPDW